MLRARSKRIDKALPVFLKISVAALIGALAGCGSSDDAAAPQVADGTKATLALLETTDIHTNV